MKGRHCPQLLGPRRQTQQGVNADAVASQVLFITPFEGSQLRVTQSVNTAESILIRSTNWHYTSLTRLQRGIVDFSINKEKLYVDFTQKEGAEVMKNMLLVIILSMYIKDLLNIKV